MLSYYNGLGRDVKLLIIGQTLLFFQMGTTQLILPLYFAKLGLDGMQIGSIITAGQLTSALTALPFGMIADKYGKKIFVLMGALLSGASFLAFGVLSCFVHLLVAGLVAGIGNGMVFASIYAWMVDVTAVEKRKEVFSLSAAMISLGFIVSSIAGWFPPFLREEFGFHELDSYRPVIYLPGLLAFLAIPVFLAAKRDSISISKRGFLPRKSLRAITKMGIVNAMIGFGAGFVIPLFSYWFYMRFGVDETVLAPLYVVANAILMFSLLLAPRLADSFGTMRTIVYSQAIATGLLVLIPMVESYLVVALLYIVRGLLMNMVAPLVDSFILGLIDPNERATLSGVMAISWNAPNSATPTIGGYLMQNVSLSMPFYLCGLLYGSAIFMFYLFFRAKDRDTPYSRENLPRTKRSGY